MNKSRFRRTAGLKWVPFFIIAVVLGYVASPAVGGLLIVVCGVAAAVMVANSFTSITIQGDSLSIGAGQRATTIANTDLVAVHYRAIVFRGRGFDLRCLELCTSQDEVGLIIPGTGWGKQTGPLLRELHHWLEGARVVVEPNVETTFFHRRQNLD